MTHRSSRACPGIVEEELERAGASYRVVVNKHYKFWVLHGGREHLFVCGGTMSGGRRAQENTRAGIRRLLRQLGIIAGRGERG